LVAAIGRGAAPFDTRRGLAMRMGKRRANPLDYVEVISAQGARARSPGGGGAWRWHRGFLYIFFSGWTDGAAGGTGGAFPPQEPSPCSFVLF